MSESNQSIMPPQSSVINTVPVTSRRLEPQVAAPVTPRIEEAKKLAR